MAGNQLDNNLKVKTESLDYVWFTFSDMHGIACGKAIPARHADVMADSGIAFYCGKVNSESHTMCLFLSMSWKVYFQDCMEGCKRRFANYITHSVCLFLCLQHYSRTTARMVME